MEHYIRDKKRARKSVYFMTLCFPNPDVCSNIPLYTNPEKVHDYSYKDGFEGWSSYDLTKCKLR